MALCALQFGHFSNCDTAPALQAIALPCNALSCTRHFHPPIARYSRAGIACTADTVAIFLFRSVHRAIAKIVGDCQLAAPRKTSSDPGRPTNDLLIQAAGNRHGNESRPSDISNL